MGYVGLHDCNLYVKTGTNRALHNIYIGFSYYFSYHSQPIWLCALCSLYGGTGTCCKTYMARIENTYYITYDYMIACNVTYMV